MDFYLRTKKNPANQFHQGRDEYFWGQGENDLQVGSDGDFALTEGIDNLNQSIAKILVTEREANQFNGLYGSLLQSFVGLNLDIDFLRSKIKADIIDTLRIYQFINRNNPEPDEQIDLLQALRIELASPDGIKVSFRVTTLGGNTATGLVTLEG